VVLELLTKGKLAACFSMPKVPTWNFVFPCYLFSESCEPFHDFLIPRFLSVKDFQGGKKY